MRSNVLKDKLSLAESTLMTAGIFIYKGSTGLYQAWMKVF